MTTTNVASLAFGFLVPLVLVGGAGFVHLGGPKRQNKFPPGKAARTKAILWWLWEWREPVGGAARDKRVAR